MSLSDYRKKVDRLLLIHSSWRTQAKKERQGLEEAAEAISALEEAQALAQSVAQRVQVQAHAKIAEIVTSCLQIFDEPYTFRIHFERKRGKTEAGLVFERDGMEVDPLEASGGGVVDVAAFALRVACLILRRPAARRLLVLDEPMKFVSAEYRGRIRALLERLAGELRIQIIMVTHDPRLETGRILPLEG